MIMLNGCTVIVKLTVIYIHLFTKLQQEGPLSESNSNDA